MSKSSILLLTAAVAAVLALSACEGGTPAKPGPSGPGLGKTQEPVTIAASGREAFQKMYLSAHLWAADARPYRLQSEVFKDYPGEDGKAVIWRAGFASASKRFIKSFLWSGTHSEDGPAFGISSGTEDTYNPNNSSTQVFDPAFVKIDSDKAFEVAQKHGGEKLLKRNPKLPVFYLLDWNPKQNILIWHVVYGISQAEAKLRVAVNASTGGFERVER